MDHLTWIGIFVLAAVIVAGTALKLSTRRKVRDLDGIVDPRVGRDEQIIARADAAAQEAAKSEDEAPAETEAGEFDSTAEENASGKIAEVSGDPEEDVPAETAAVDEGAGPS